MKIEFLKLYKVVIKVYDHRGKSYGEKDILIWDDLTFQILTKWRWYFDYRSALKKVENPKCNVEMFVVQKEPNTKTTSDFLKDKISSKKRMITKISNQIELHKNWLIDNNIFGLGGDDGRLDKAYTKLNNYQLELQQLTKDFQQLEVI